MVIGSQVFGWSVVVDYGGVGIVQVLRVLYRFESLTRLFAVWFDNICVPFVHALFDLVNFVKAFSLSEFFLVLGVGVLAQSIRGGE